MEEPGETTSAAVMCFAGVNVSVFICSFHCSSRGPLTCHAWTSCLPTSRSGTSPSSPGCCPWSPRRRPVLERGSYLSPLYLAGCFPFEVSLSVSAPKPRPS